MEKRSPSCSDDGFIDDEIEDSTNVMDDKNSNEPTDIEDVCEQIEQVDIVETNELGEEENSYDIQTECNEKSFEKPTKTSHSELQNVNSARQEKPPKKNIFCGKPSRVNPTNSEEILSTDDSKSRLKLCCIWKESDEYKRKLPKYNGFNSNYGLSKEEIARRESIQQKQQQLKHFRALQEVEQKVRNFY